ncbi:MAG: response regulator [Anaerolineae bacterium]|nr:response regulator [Anaerolineae bacterium]
MATRILVVDDELDTLSLLRTILEISGYEPITTLNSVDAIDLAEAEKPDVVLLDIMMPRLDGFTLCKMMRENQATRHLPIIFVTAYEALDIEDRRVESGADRVIRKPIDMDVLVDTISDVQRTHAVRAQKNGDTMPDSAQDRVTESAKTQETRPANHDRDKPSIT